MKGKPKFKKQKMMNRVLYALIPALLGSVYFFGWRCLVMLLFVCAVGCATEFYMAKRRNDPLTAACLVTCFLFALSLPPTTPFWIAAVGIIVALLFGKEVFGGFGRNVFNPAIVGRGFVYVCFPTALTNKFTPVWEGTWGGLTHWGPQTTVDGINAVSSATPMWSNRDFGFTAELTDLFTGNIGQVFESSDGVTRVLSAGSMGEVSAILVLLGGIYLLWTKTANWRLVVSPILGASFFVLIFRNLLGFEQIPPVPWTLCSGAMLFASFFMTTDPVSAPKHKTSQLWYGAFIGIMIVFLRWKAVFAGGVAFAILLGNTVAPTLDMIFKSLDKRKKSKATVQKAEVKNATV